MKKRKKKMRNWHRIARLMSHFFVVVRVSNGYRLSDWRSSQNRFDGIARSFRSLVLPSAIRRIDVRRQSISSNSARVSLALSVSFLLRVTYHVTLRFQFNFATQKLMPANLRSEWQFLCVDAPQSPNDIDLSKWNMNRTPTRTPITI